MFSGFFSETCIRFFFKNLIGNQVSEKKPSFFKKTSPTSSFGKKTKFFKKNQNLGFGKKT